MYFVLALEYNENLSKNEQFILLNVASLRVHTTYEYVLLVTLQLYVCCFKLILLPEFLSAIRSVSETTLSRGLQIKVCLFHKFRAILSVNHAAFSSLHYIESLSLNRCLIKAIMI